MTVFTVIVSLSNNDENIDNSQTFSQSNLSREAVMSEENERKEITKDEVDVADMDKVNKEISKFSLSEEADCGEPMLSQHLRIDFTPTEHDTSEVSDKCFEFWKFINNRSDLQHLKVNPVKSHYTSISSQSTKETKSALCPALDWVVNDDKMNDAFMVKEKTRYCEQSDGDYCDHSYNGQMLKSAEIGQESNKMKLNSIKLRRRAKGRSSRVCGRGSSINELKNLSKDMKEWDSLHPRSMDPPGRVPQVDYAIKGIYDGGV